MRSTVFSLLLSPALFFCCNAAIAQQSNKPVTPVPQHLEDLSAAAQSSKGGAPQPSPEIQSLTKALSGKWSLSVKWEPDASMPNGLVNTGEENWRAGPGGYTLLEEEHLRMPQGDVFLLGVVWWNLTTKNLQGMECQNLLPYTCDVKGALNDITMSWDGKEFVIDEIETSTSGKKSMWHEVWSDITPTSFTQTGEYGEPAAPRKRLFTIHATAVSVDTTVIAKQSRRTSLNSSLGSMRTMQSRAVSFHKDHGSRSPVLGQRQDSEAAGEHPMHTRGIRRRFGGTCSRPLPTWDSLLRAAGTARKSPDLGRCICAVGTTETISSTTTELGIFTAKGFWSRSPH